jgi:hypothetical protein
MRRAHDGFVSGQQGPQGDTNKMKKALLAIALTLGVASLTFAQTTPTNPPDQKDTTKKKSGKKKSGKKAPKKTDGGASNPSSSK